jgi:hypothetical protein
VHLKKRIFSYRWTHVWVLPFNIPMPCNGGDINLTPYPLHQCIYARYTRGKHVYFCNRKVRVQYTSKWREQTQKVNLSLLLFYVRLLLLLIFLLISVEQIKQHKWPLFGQNLSIWAASPYLQNLRHLIDSHFATAKIWIIWPRGGTESLIDGWPG